MAKFAVGEIAVGVGFVIQTWRNGAECEILEPLRFKHAVNKLSGDLYKGQMYYVKWSNGEKASIMPYLLKKRPHPPDWNALSDPRTLPVEELA
jgi:hypothetical protein